MPYKSIEKLPENVRNPLPVAAQRIWLRVFNKVMEDGGSEDSARRQAWGAIRNAKYRKKENGDWVKMNDERLYIPFSDNGDGWYLLFPTRRVFHNGRSIDFTPDLAQAAVENFKSEMPPYPPPVNEQHSDSLGGVYGVIDDMRVTGRGLEWKPKWREGKLEEARTKGFRFISPEVIFSGYQHVYSGKTSDTPVFVGAALTPRPRLGASTAIFSEQDGWEYAVKQTLLEKLMDKVDKLLADKYECECPECGHKMESDEHCKDTECPECGTSMRREDRPSEMEDMERRKETRGDSVDKDDEENNMSEVAEKVSQSVIERIDSWFNERFGETEEDFSEELDAFKEQLTGEFTEQMGAKEAEIAELSEAKETLEAKAQELEEKFAEEEHKRRLAEFTDKAQELGVPVEAEEFGEVLMRFHDSSEADYEMLLSVLEARGNIQETNDLFGEKGSDADTGDNLEKFSALVKERMEKKDESWGEASEHVMEERPELYAEYNKEAVKASDYDDVGDNVDVV